MSDEENKKTKEELRKEIKRYQFAVIELGLYLDTHPNDNRAISMHRRYSTELLELQEKYQRMYGPLTINYPGNTWAWINTPWPWERRDD